MENPVYKTKLLIENEVDFNAINPDRASYAQDQMGFGFDLQQVVTLLQDQTQDFTLNDHTCKELDAQIYKTVMDWYEKQGIKVAWEVKAQEAEPKEEKELTPEQSEWVETIATLSELSEDEDDNELKDEWKQTIDALVDLLKDEGVNVSNKGIIKAEKGGLILKVLKN